MVRSKSWPSRFLDCHCTSNRKLAFSLMPTKRPLRVSIAMMQRNSENRREEREHESRSRPQKRGEKEVARGASPMWEKSIIILSQKNLDLGLLQARKKNPEKPHYFHLISNALNDIPIKIPLVKKTKIFLVEKPFH